MIVDITGTILIPGNLGNDCPGNGIKKRNVCCCDECGYMMCCMEGHNMEECQTCADKNCPHALRAEECIG